MKTNQKGFIRLTKKALTTYLIVSTLFLGTGLVYLFGPWTKTTEAAWFNEDWAYRKSILVTNGTTTQTNVYITTGVIDTSDTTKFQSDCGDIRFTKQNGEILPYYKFAACGASSNFHVNFDSLPTGDTTIYMYYGNPGVADGFRATDFSSAATNMTIGSPGTEVKGLTPTLDWKFDAGVDNTCTGGANDACNSGNGGTTLDGAAANGTTWQTEDFCISGKCLYFAGTDDNVSTADNDKLDFLGTDLFTVSAWVRHSGAVSAINYILDKSSAAGTSYTGYKMYIDASGNFCFDVKDGTTAASACSSGTSFADNKWHFVTGVRESSSSTKIYVDGVLKTTSATAVSNTLANSGIFYTGVDTGGTANEFTGFIDEVKVTRDNAARTAAQVLADYNARGNPEGVALQAGLPQGNNPGALANGLVGYWKMQETASPSLDSSGNGNSGTWTGTTSSVSGKFGNGNSFDGSGDYILSTNNVFDPSTTDFTASIWFNTTSLAASENLITQQDGTGTGRGWMRIEPSGIISNFLGNGNITTTGTVSTGAWNQAVVTKSGTTVKIYLNGVLDVTNTTTTTESATGVTVIGASKALSGSFNGTLDEARVYNRALSNAEVSQLYNFAPGPYHYWKLDENTGQTVTDLGTKGDSGTLGANSSVASDDPTWVPGKYGSALNYDGSNDYAQIGNAHLNGLGALTMEAWVKRRAVNSLVTLGDTGCVSGGVPTTAAGFEIYSDGLVYFTLGNSSEICGGAGIPYAYFSSNDINWHHIVFVYDGLQPTNATKIKGYLDGVQQTLSFGGGNFGSAANVADTNFRLGLCGGVGSCATEWTDGKIDDVKIYDYIKNQGQIIEDMNAGHPAPGSPVGTPLGWWRFDEGYSTVAHNSGSQGSTLDGTLTNMATAPSTSTSGWTQSGKFNKGLIFEGTAGSSDDIVDAGSATAVDNLTAGPMSLSAWIYPISIGKGSAGVIMAKNGNNTAPSAGWLWQLTSTSNLKFSVDGSTDLIVNSTGNPVTLAAWNYVTLTYDGVFSPSHVHMYVNGLEVSYGAVSGGTAIVSDAASNLFIGNNNSTSLANTFDGTIDEVKIFGQQLTTDQIKIDMNRGLAQSVGALSDKSTYQKQAANQLYCVPGDTASCAAPVGRWDLEENTGTTANDTSVNGKTATITAGTGGWVSGKVGAGYNFDGANTKIQTSSTFAQPNPMTLEAWIYPTSMGEGSVGEIFAHGTGTTNLAFTGTNGLKFTQEWTGNDGVWTIADSSITLNAWNHVALTYNGSSTSNAPAIYVNGISKTVTTVTPPTTAETTTAAAWVIGNNSGQSATFAGKIDNFVVFDYARSAAQVAWDYNKGGPVGLWRMDECQGTTINDASGNSNTGTLTVGATGTYTAPGTCSASSASSAWYNGATGKRNYSLAFDGTDDRVNIPDPASGILDFAATDSFSFVTWVKFDSTGSGFQAPLSKGGTTASAAGYGFELSSGCPACIKAQISDGGGGGSDQTVATYTSPSSLRDNTWHHLVGVANRTTNLLKIYVDGVERDSQDISSVGSVANSLALSLASNSLVTPSDYMKGQVDDARVYNYALTLTQVKTIYNENAIRYGPVTGAP